MQFEKLDSRRLRVTDLPSTVEGLRVDAKELEVIVSYVGDPGGRKAIVLDNVVNPLMFAAPVLYDALQDMLDEADLGAVDEETALIAERARAALAMARGEEVNV